MISDPPGSFINGSDNSFGYLVGSDVNLTCLVTPTPPSDSEYSWSCSTGCFFDMEIEQSVNVSELELTDEGVLNCSVMIDGVEFFSDPYELVVVLGKRINLYVVFSYIEAPLTGKEIIKLQNRGKPRLKSRHKITGLELCWLLSG